MPRIWHGFFFDGRSAARRPVTIELTSSELKMSESGGRTIRWPYGRIRQSQGAYQGEQVRLEYGGPAPQALIVDDAEFLVALRRVAPDYTSRLHDPTKRSLRLTLTMLAALAVVGLTACLYAWGIPAVASVVAPLVPVAWEERLGEAVMEQLAPPAGRCTDSDRLTALNRVVGVLTSGMPAFPYRVRVAVVDRPQVNAFAAPGGAIVVFRGLLEKTESAEQLAGVLAHELQHVAKQHSTKLMLEQASTSLLITAISGDFTGALTYGIEGARVLGMLRYSRSHEEEADREGLRVLQSIGIDPTDMIQFFRILGAEHPAESSASSYLSSHPRMGERIAHLTTLIGPRHAYPVKLLPDKQWTDIRTLCRHRSPAAPSIPAR